MPSTSSEASETTIRHRWDSWWQVCRQRALQVRRNRWWRRALQDNASLWAHRSAAGDDPLPGTRIPPWAMDLLNQGQDGHAPSLSSLLHGGLIGVWRKHREPFEMISTNAQEFMDTLEWARDRDQGPVWDVVPLRGRPDETPVLQWAQSVAKQHHASLFSAPLNWFVPEPRRDQRAQQRNAIGPVEHRLPDDAHALWRQGVLRVLDGTSDSNTPMQVMGLQHDPEWPVVVVRWNPIALAVMTGRWDRVREWSHRAPQAALDAQHLLTVMGKTPGMDRPQDVANWERWVLNDLTHAPNPSMARARARL